MAPFMLPHPDNFKLELLIRMMLWPADLDMHCPMPPMTYAPMTMAYFPRPHRPLLAVWT